jgi:hypothetical protein
MAPKGYSFSQERDAENRPPAANLLARAVPVFRIGQNIGDVDDFAFKQDPPLYRTSPPDFDRVTCDEFGELR